MVGEPAVRVSVVSMDGKAPPEPISWVTTESGEHLPDGTEWIPAPRVVSARRETYKFVVEVPVVSPPPDHQEAVRARLEKEMKLFLGPDAVVRIKKKKSKRK